MANLYFPITSKFQPTRLSLKCLRNIRKSMESIDRSPYMEDPSFMHLIKYFMICKGDEELQLEACWILTNIAAGDSAQVQMLMSQNVMPLIVDLIPSSNEGLAEQAIWAIGNIVGDSTRMRDEVLKFNVIQPIIKCLDVEEPTLSYVRTLSWVLVNFVRSSDDPLPLNIVRQVIPGLFKLIDDLDDVPTRIDALWGLTYIADCGNEYIQAIIDTNLLEQIITMIGFERPKIQHGAIRLLGNIATGTDDQGFVLIQNGILQNIHDLLFSHVSSIRRTTLWCLSNLALGPLEHITEMIESHLLPGIVAGLTYPDMRVVKEAVLTIHNIICGSTPDYMINIIDSFACTPLFELVHNDDQQIAQVAANALSELFNKATQLVVGLRLIPPEV